MNRGKNKETWNPFIKILIILLGIAVIALIIFALLTEAEPKVTAPSGLQKIEVPSNQELIVKSQYDVNSNTINLFNYSRSEIESYSLNRKNNVVLKREPDLLQMVRSGDYLVTTTEDSYSIDYLKTGSAKTVSDAIIENPKIIKETLIYKQGTAIIYESLNEEKRENIDLGENIMGNGLIDYSSNYAVIIKEKNEQVIATIYNRKEQTDKTVEFSNIKEPQVVKMTNEGLYISYYDANELQLLVYDLESNEAQEIKTEDLYSFDAVDNLLAVQVDENVKVYERNGGELKALNIFDDVVEGLIMPKFSPDGSLLVGIEDEDEHMYLWRK